MRVVRSAQQYLTSGSPRSCIAKYHLRHIQGCTGWLSGPYCRLRLRDIFDRRQFLEFGLYLLSSLDSSIVYKPRSRLGAIEPSLLKTGGCSPGTIIQILIYGEFK